MKHSIEKIRRIVRASFPEYPQHPHEHPITAVAVVLLSAAYLKTVDTAKLRSFTGYRGDLLYGVELNMQN
jgi:hypothetical protein